MSKIIKVRNKIIEELDKLDGDSYSDKIGELLNRGKPTVNPTVYLRREEIEELIDSKIHEAKRGY